MSENDFIVDKNGILLDCPPGTLHLDENGIVQDTDYSVLQLADDYEDTRLSLYDSQPYQSFNRRSHLGNSWYCISDLEISDDEKNAVSIPENVPIKRTYNGRQPTHEGHVEIPDVSPGNQLFDYTRVINNNFPNSPLNSKTSHELLHYIYNDQDPLEVFMNQPNSSLQPNNSDTVTNYHTPAASNMYLYEKRDFLAESGSSSKSSLSIPEGLTTSERELYLKHATISQILDSSHNENYQLEEEQQVQDDDDDDDDDVDDELFLITGHIDFGTQQPSRPGSANVLEYSSGLGQEMSNGSERNCPKGRVEKRSVSFDLLPQEQSFNPNEEIPSFVHDSMTISLPDNLQDNDTFFNQKRFQDQCFETNQRHPEFDRNISERHSRQFQEIKKMSGSFLNEDISLNSDSNLINGKSQVKSEALRSSYSQHSSDGNFQVFHNQKISVIPENLNGKSKLVNQRNTEEIEKHQKKIENAMNKFENSGYSELEEGSLSKSKMDDSVKSFRTKSKSTTNICSTLTPIKSKYKSLSELSNIPTDGDDSIKDLNAKLEEELSKRKKATQLVEQLQNRYDNLLTKYADAEMMIDELRIGSKMAPKIPDFKSSQSPITNLIMNRALVTSTPMASTFSMNQSLREDDNRLPLNTSVILNKSERNTKTNDEPPSKSEKIKEHLLLQAKHLESKINTLVSLLEKRQLTVKELKKVFDNIKSEQDKQRREYLRVKEEFQIIRTNNEDAFDKDKELEGFLFQLQMRFDELEDKHKHLQENQKEPFQEMANKETETDACPKMVANLQSKDEAEKKRQKFLSQYNSLMERYQRLKISGNLNENDEEVKKIKKKLQEISDELCLNEQQQQKLPTSSDAGRKIKDSPKVKNLISGQNVGLLEGNHKTNTTNSNQRIVLSHPKKLDPKTSRIVRSLPAPPKKESREPSNKKSDEVSSTTSVPDSGIFEELNGTSQRHPSMRLASSRGQRVQPLVPVHSENSDGPVTMDNNSPRVSVAPDRHRNSSGLAEVSSQSTEATLLNSQIHGDDSLLWQPAMTPLHDLSGHGRSTESEPIEYSSGNSDQTDLDTSERPVLIRRARPKSILRRKYKPSKSRPPSTEKIEQKSERIKHKGLTTDSLLEQRQGSKSNTSSFEKTERRKLRQRSSSLDSQNQKPNEQSPEIKSSNKEKLRNLQLEIESLKARFNNGMPWKNAAVISSSTNDSRLREISSTGTNLPSSNIYHNNVPQEILYQTTVRSSPEDIHWKDPPPTGSYRGISNFNSIDASNSTRVNNSNAVMASSESPTPYSVQKGQNTCITLLDYHSPVLHKKAPPKSLPPKSLVSSEPEHRSNYPFYLSIPNNNLPSARSFQDISQIQTDPNLHMNQRQYRVLNQSSDYPQSTNNLAPEPVCCPPYNQLEDVNYLKGQRVFNPPHYSHNPSRVPAALLHSDTFQRQSHYNPIPNAINRNSTLQFSRNCTPIPHSAIPICDICGMSGCSHNYVTEVNYTHPAQRGTIPIPAPTYSVYNSQNMSSDQRNHSNYRNYQLEDGDLTESINLAEKTIEDINHLTRKMMRTMHEELIKSKRNYDMFYHF